MRILLILVLLLANLMLFGANHQMFGPVPYAGLRNPAPLKRELNPSGMQVRPMAPGEYVDHPVVGPADPTVHVKQEDLTTPASASAASGASAASASSAPSAASTSSTPAGASAVEIAPASHAAAASAAPAAGATHAHRHRKPPHHVRT
jgi:hypothetical protein